MTTMKQSFREYLEETYSEQEIRDIAKHGCEGGVDGMIFYSETTELYDEFAEDLHDHIMYHMEMGGEFPDFILNNFSSPRHFKNAMVWLVTESIACELVDDKYDTIEYAKSQRAY